MRGEVGWSTFEERIRKAVLGYKVRLRKMSENRWARKVYEWAGQGTRWNKSSISWEKRCGLEGFTLSEMKLAGEEKEVIHRVNDRDQRGAR